MIQYCHIQGGKEPGAEKEDIYTRFYISHTVFRLKNANLLQLRKHGSNRNKWSSNSASLEEAVFPSSSVSLGPLLEEVLSQGLPQISTLCHLEPLSSCASLNIINAPDWYIRVASSRIMAHLDDI